MEGERDLHFLILEKLSEICKLYSALILKFSVRELKIKRIKFCEARPRSLKTIQYHDNDW